MTDPARPAPRPPAVPSPDAVAAPRPVRPPGLPPADVNVQPAAATGTSLPEDRRAEHTRTGHAAVDEVLATLEGLSGRPVDEHVAVFESTHALLRAVLDGAADAAATAPPRPAGHPSDGPAAERATGEWPSAGPAARA